MASQTIKQELEALDQKFLNRQITALEYDAERARLEASPFFPPAGEGARAVPAFALYRLPFPLAVTYRRLMREMDNQEPIAAAWALKDAFEAGLKLSACMAVADLLASVPAGDEAAGVVVQRLFSGGLTLGHWYRLLTVALKPELPERRLPALRALFLQAPSLKSTALKKRLGEDDSNFVNWRNKVFGHGVFKQDREFYKKETTAWLPHLNEFFAGLAGVLADWTLVDAGRGIVWQGAGEPPPWDGHEHRPAGAPVPMALAQRKSGAQLALGPLLSVQLCDICRFPHAFFFDGNRYESDKDRYKTDFLEFHRGHSRRERDLGEIRVLAGRLPPDFKRERTAYDQEAAETEIQIAFHSFEKDYRRHYRRPDYLFTALERILDQRTRGYVHLIGPEGTGKSWFVRGLAAEQDVPVLAYYIRAGERTDYRTFVSLLADEARERFKMRTQEMQTRVEKLTELKDQFIESMRIIMEANSLTALLVVIDGLDELPEPEPGSASIVDFLPAAEKLPQGCRVLLTSREQLGPYAGRALDGLRSAGEFESLRLDPASPDNRALVAAYVEKRLEQPKFAEAVLERSGGVFLWAFHLTQAIHGGAFTEAETLPEGRAFYPAYLQRLRDRVGAELYETVYLRLLLFLTAARSPVPLAQLVAWGIPGERLRFALLDLRDFLTEQRSVPWHDSLGEAQEYRYAIAHEAFKHYVEQDPELGPQLTEAHRQITETLQASYGARWAEADPTDDQDLYALRYWFAHLRLAGEEVVGADRVALVDYLSACFQAGVVSWKRDRHWIAVDLFDNMIAVYRPLVDAGEEELANLAAALMNQGVALRGLGKLEMAVACYEEAIGIRRPLVAKRPELANDLAGALVNRALVYEQQKDWETALADYGEAIQVLEARVRDGALMAAGPLLKTFRYRLMTLRDLERWAEVAETVLKHVGWVVSLVAPLTDVESAKDQPWAEEIRVLWQIMDKLTPPQRTALLDTLGEHADSIKKLFGW